MEWEEGLLDDCYNFLTARRNCSEIHFKSFMMEIVGVCPGLFFHCYNKHHNQKQLVGDTDTHTSLL